MNPAARTIRATAFALLLALPIAPHAAADGAADCADFQWDMSRELALYRSQATAIKAGDDAARAPTVEAERLYAVDLLPQAAVTFAQPPGAHRTVEAPSAGLLVLRIERGGHYRVSADGPAWIDVVAGKSSIKAAGFNGHAHCSLIHKSVDLELPAHVPLILQLSQSPTGRLRLAITPAPAPNPAVIDLTKP
jgi:hypothetical protein